MGSLLEDKLKRRSMDFAIAIVKLVKEMPNDRASNAIGRQIVRSGTSVAANYRAACRAKSTADFIAKLSIVEEEADETAFWLDLIVESRICGHPSLPALRKEIEELLAITVKSIKTTKLKKQNRIL